MALKRWLVVAGVLCISLPVSQTALAVTFSYSLHLTGTSSVNDTTDTSVSLDGATASIGYSPTVSLTSTSADNTEAASASVFYQFTLNGPTTGIGVPINIAWSTSLAAATAASASEYILIGSTYLTDESGISGTTYANSGVYATTASTGTAQGVLMLASAHGSTNGSASAFVDPYLSIDPSFFSDNPGYNPSDFSFSFSSPLIQNAQSESVPEPSSLAMLAAGLVALGKARRARRALKRARLA